MTEFTMELKLDECESTKIIKTYGSDCVHLEELVQAMKDGLLAFGFTQESVNAYFLEE